MDYGPHGIAWQVKREGQKGTHASESAFVGDPGLVAENQVRSCEVLAVAPPPERFGT
jgi:hypothetical protein